MKKYLMTGITALALCVGFTSCSHDLESLSQEEIDQLEAQKITEKYNKAFIATFGRPAADQDWGFGSSTRSFTRAALPETPTFRDTNPIEKPTVPSQYKNTLTEAIAAGAKYAKVYQNYQKGDVIYIDTEYQQLNQPQNTEDLTIYVDGNVTFCGQTNQNGNYTVFCVTENSTLTLGAVSTKLIVYLAPGATLDITKGLKENVIKWYPYQSEIVESGNNSFSFQNSPAAIYMSNGSKVKATDLTLINGAKLLNDGGTIEASNLTLDEEAILWNEGSIKVTNTLTLTNESSTLYNLDSKTIETANLDLINNNALLFNEGRVIATGAVVLHNTDAEVINYGTLSCASYSQAAGGKTHNHGTVTMSGKTDLTNSNSKWMNDGQWTCGSFDVDNYSHVNINNCRLTVNGQFHLNRGTFVLGAESGVVCNSFAWEDTSDFYLGNKSVLKVKGDLVTENANSGYGFRGIGTEYAVIEAASITHNGNEQFRMSYYGKLLVATSNHFEQWYKDAPNTNQPAYWYENTVKFTKDGDNITTIPEDECNPGYKGKDPDPTPDPFEAQLRIMAEDLSASEKSDFDFNDIVFDVQYTTDTHPARILVRAAGGTLPLRIRIGGTKADRSDWEWQEIHALWGKSTGIMINTNATTIVGGGKGYEADYDLKPIDLKYEVAGKADAKNIIIEVNKGGAWREMVAEKGMPAAKFACSPDHKWADELQSLSGNTNFEDWVQGKASNWEWTNF